MLLIRHDSLYDSCLADRRCFCGGEFKNDEFGGKF